MEIDILTNNIILPTLKRAIYLILFLFVFSSNIFTQDNTQKMEVVLTLENNEVVVGEPIIITFTVNNHSDETQKFCRYLTPLEGFKGNIFDVANEKGEKIKYSGVMVKRAAPKRKDHIKLKPGESTTVSIDLIEAYPIDKPDLYKIIFKGRESMNMLPDSDPVMVRVDPK